MEWLLQNLLSAAVWEILLLIGLGAVLGILKAKLPLVASSVLYGLAGVTCLAVIVFTLTGRPILSHQRTTTSTENIESNIKSWAADLEMAIQRLPSAPDVYFSFLITLKNGNPVTISRNRALPGYLQMQTLLALSPENQEILAKLNKEQTENVTQEVVLELARSKIGYSLSGPDPGHLMQNVVLMKAAPITTTLTQDAFASYLNEIDSAVSLVRATTTLALGQYTQSVIPPCGPKR